jgi:hypothetical protein
LGSLEDDLRPVGLARFGVRRCATARTKLPPVRRHLRRQRLAAGLAGGSFGNRNGLAGRMSPATMRTLPRL